MPWRLILFIIIFVIFMAFVMLNLDNRCDVNFGFTKLEKIPVFLTVFISFLAGLISAFPLVLHIKKTRKDKLIKDLQSKPAASPVEVLDAPPPNEQVKQDAADAKKRFFAKRKDGKN